MNPKELFFSDGKSANLFSCDVCGNLFNRGSLDIAERCCKTSICRFCGKEVEDSHRTVHDACYNANRLENAEKVDSWDGWLFFEGLQPEFFENMGDLIDALENENITPWPQYAFACDTMRFSVKGILDTIIENVCEEMYEDAADQLSGVEDLEKALQEFEKANEGMVSYSPNFKKAVRIPGREEHDEN